VPLLHFLGEKISGVVIFFGVFDAEHLTFAAGLRWVT
jgi:hypothetical protein